MPTRTANAPANPITGETAPGTMTLCHTPDHSTPAVPDWTSAAPIKATLSACVELEGRPARQVRRFQVIAPKSAASTVCSVTRPVSISPLPTVVATAGGTDAPARFAAAEISTADRGESARVPTHVAT